MPSSSSSPKMRSSRNAAFISAFSRVTIVHHQHHFHTTCTLSPLTTFTSYSSSPSSLSFCRSLTQQFQTHRRRLRPFPFYASASAIQQETEWNEVQVISVTNECEQHTILTVNVGATYSLGSLTDSYRVPGMYVKLLPSIIDIENKKPAFLAISSPPTITGVFEFLIKDSDSTEWIKKLQPGDSVYSSPVQGPGFRLSSIEPPPEHIILFATGSGIAPIRAAIESPLNGVFPKKRKSVTLLYGARTPQRMPYMNKFDEWRQNGVNVIPVISRPKDSVESWDGYTGYVQHVLDEIQVEDIEKTAVLLCGLRGMTDDVRQKLIDSGITQSNILFNF